MPPKKDKKADFADDGDQGMNPEAFKTNYTKFCKLIAVPANQKIVDQLTDEEKLEAFMKHNQLVVDDEFGALGPGQEKGAKFPTSKARISVVFHSFRLIFGRGSISRTGLDREGLSFERTPAEHSR